MRCSSISVLCTTYSDIIGTSTHSPAIYIPFSYKYNYQLLIHSSVATPSPMLMLFPHNTLTSHNPGVLYFYHTSCCYIVHLVYVWGLNISHCIMYTMPRRLWQVLLLCNRLGLVWYGCNSLATVYIMSRSPLS